MPVVDVLEISIISFILISVNICVHFLVFTQWSQGRPTFWHVHGIQAAQQVSDVQVVAFLPAQPVVAGEAEAQVGTAHVGDHHPVQEPAGVHPRVVVLDPGQPM